MNARMWMSGLTMAVCAACATATDSAKVQSDGKAAVTAVAADAKTEAKAKDEAAQKVATEAAAKAAADAKAKADALAQAAADRAKALAAELPGEGVLDARPAISPLQAFEAPVPTEKKLANGLRILVVEKAGAPIEALAFVVRRGATADPEGKAGLASLTAAMLEAGSNKRSQAQIAALADAMGAVLRWALCCARARAQMGSPSRSRASRTSSRPWRRSWRTWR